jgi:hypothetical protein
LSYHASLSKINFANNSMILVDSTRSGKRIPDALSKTVPIWCAVINRAHLIRRVKPREGVNPPWDTSLYTPPSTVSRQEHHQIEQRLDNWAQALAVGILHNLIRFIYHLFKLPGRLPRFYSHRCQAHFGRSGSLLPTLCFLNLIQSRPAEETFFL